VPVEPDYWRLWAVGLILNSARYLEMIVMAIFVYRETNSAFLVAAITMLRMLPMSLFGALLGAATDRFDRRACLIIVVLANLATTLALAILAYFGMLQVWHLAAASFLNGVGWTTDFPGRRMMIAEVVGLKRLNVAMSIEAGSSQASRITGPALGGVLFASAGPTLCFGLEAALCAVAFVITLGVTYRNAPHPTAAGRMLAHITDGLKAAYADIRLRNALLVTVIFNLFVWPCTSMVPVIGHDQLHLNADGIGILAATEGVGAVIGSVLVAIWSRPRHYSALYIGGVVLAMAALIAFALSPTPILSGSTLLLMGIATAGFSVMQATMIYAIAPPDMRGRVLGLISVCIGVSPIGFLMIGVLADAIGAQGAIIVSALTGLVVMAAMTRQWLVLIRP
jgi:MFS family permease